MPLTAPAMDCAASRPRYLPVVFWVRLDSMVTLPLVVLPSLVYPSMVPLTVVFASLLLTLTATAAPMELLFSASDIAAPVE